MIEIVNPNVQAIYICDGKKECNIYEGCIYNKNANFQLCTRTYDANHSNNEILTSLAESFTNIYKSTLDYFDVKYDKDKGFILEAKERGVENG